VQYYNRLDSVRGIAALMVVICHWTKRQTEGSLDDLAVIGVTMFFVLSGFLITKILLQAKENNLQLAKPQLPTIKNFIMRRALRIFPIYYLVIAITYFFQNYFQIDFSGSIFYYLTYTSNIYYYLNDGLESILGVTWTLAIEEQFYLFFPWFILFFNNKWTKYFLWALFIVGVLFFPKYFRFIIKELSLQGWKPLTRGMNILTPSAFDSLGIGALLAYFTVYLKDKVIKYFHIITSLGVLSIVLYVLAKLKILPFINHTTCVSIVSLWLIAAIVYEKRIFILDTLLNSKGLIFLGKISYGIYLYHQLVSFVYRKTKRSMDITFSNFMVDFSLRFALLILVAYCSWRFIEKPIMKLKKHFPY